LEKNAGSRLVVAIRQGSFRKCFGLICKLAVKFPAPASAGWIWIARRRKNGGFRAPPSPPPLAAGECEASAATAALVEPRETLYCTLLLLLLLLLVPCRCIPVSFRLCERRSHAYRGCWLAAPCAPPTQDSIRCPPWRRCTATWQSGEYGAVREVSSVNCSVQ
jgi:hypothetical protein